MFLIYQIVKELGRLVRLEKGYKKIESSSGYERSPQSGKNSMIFLMWKLVEAMWVRSFNGQHNSCGIYIVTLEQDPEIITMVLTCQIEPIWMSYILWSFFIDPTIVWLYPVSASTRTRSDSSWTLKPVNRNKTIKTLHQRVWFDLWL
jgi:hypothetical protein